MKKLWNCKTSFTLIEMLAVMFIICIIFSIALPAFGPIIRTMKLTTAAENLANVLESARQYAITSGVDCYVVFPTTTGDTDMDYKAYKIYKPDTNTTIGKWEFLPNSVKIHFDCTFITKPPDPATININFPEDTDTSQQAVTYIDFKPNGAATLNRTIKLTDINDTNLFRNIVFYNQPIKIEVKDVG